MHISQRRLITDKVLARKSIIKCQVAIDHYVRAAFINVRQRAINQTATAVDITNDSRYVVAPRLARANVRTL